MGSSEKSKGQKLLKLSALGSVLVSIALGIAVVYLVIYQRKPIEIDRPVTYPPPLPPKPATPAPDLPNSKLGIYSKAAVVSDADSCATYGKDVLERGGGAVDAAITTLLCNGAVHSHSMGLGGGFFMLVYKRQEAKAYFLNARETAPLKATEMMYVNKSQDSILGPLSIGVPGEIKGYFEAKEKFGNPDVSMASLMEPIIKLCKEGIKTTRSLARATYKTKDKIEEDETMRATFMKYDKMLEEGDMHRRPLLAKTLETLATLGADAFYNGSLGEQIVKEIQDMGGILSMEDLNNYQVAWEDTDFVDLSNGMRMHVPTLPSSGVVTAFVVKMMDMLVNKDKVQAKLSPNVYQLFIEAMKYGFAQRTNMGDKYMNEILNVTLQGRENLLSEEWSEEVMKKLSLFKTYQTPSHYDAQVKSSTDDHGTTHISVLAPNGDAVSVTSSVNYYFGSKVMSPSTGIILNNHMDDFATDPVKPNLYDLVPSPANKIVPGKRPLSSMSPALVVNTKTNDIKMVVGASGGPNIISTTAFVTMQHLLFDKNIKEAIDENRVHHQLLPMHVSYEKLLKKTIVNHLAKIGHKMVEFDPYNGKGYQGGRVQAISVDQQTKIVTANYDRRKTGSVDGF